MLLAAGGMSLFLVLVIRGNATNDALQLDEIMQAFSRGDYSSLQEGGYLFVYPFQMTYVLIGQVIQALCGPSNYLVYQLLNVVSILCNLYFLYQITWELFHDRKVCAVMQLLSMGCWFYYVFATFIYADLWSFAVQSAAFLLEIRYLNRRRLRDIIGAGICIAAATLLKTNCYVALIAMILILLMDAVREAVSEKNGKAASGTAFSESVAASGDTVGTASSESVAASGDTVGNAPSENAEASGNSAGALILRAVLIGAMFVVLTKGAQSAVNLGTARAAGIEKMPEGVPSAAYFAMGMEETEGKYGWYNGRNVGLFRDAGYDREQTVLDARETMKASIGEFQNSKRYLIRFYAGKFLSQWGDPTCVSMREMEETRRHTGEHPKLVDSLIFGTGSRILQWGMNVTHSLIYLGLTIYLFSVIGAELRTKQKLGMLAKNGQQAPNAQQAQEQAQKQEHRLRTVSEPEILLVLFLVGGMLFHQIWEASGRYTMRYYLTMLPLAAWGICRLIGGKQQKA